MRCLLTSIFAFVALAAVLSQLVLAGDPSHIRVKTRMGKILHIKLLTDKSVAGLKKVIESHQGIPIAAQVLIYGDWVLSDKKLFSDYGIKDNSILSLYVQSIDVDADTKPVDYPVNVELWTFPSNHPAEKFVIIASSNDTGATLKDKIKEKMSYPQIQQRLKCDAGKIMDDNLLVDYGVRSGDKIILNLLSKDRVQPAEGKSKN